MGQLTKLDDTLECYDSCVTLWALAKWADNTGLPDVCSASANVCPCTPPVAGQFCSIVFYADYDWIITITGTSVRSQCCAKQRLH